jgi:hypothetical protein
MNIVTDDTNTVSDLLKKKNIIQNTDIDIDMDMDKMEQGIVFDYDDTGSDENNYQSEDENLISLSVNDITSHNNTANITNNKISLNNSISFNKSSFRKLEYKDVEYRIDKAYFDINHKYSSALDILASYLKGHKVIYVESKTNVVPKLDTTQIRIADLPILMEGTQFLLHPIGEVRVYDGSNRGSYGSSSTSKMSYAISNYNRFEITGYLQNIHFQHVDSISVRPLTDKAVVIQTATYLNTIAEKSKKQILVYTISDLDTNKDSKLDANDIKSLYISEISGSNFLKLTPDFQELIDWDLVDAKNRLYFRSTEDTNKNGGFDKEDAVFYYYVNLLDKEWKLNEYKPFN